MLTADEARRSVGAIEARLPRGWEDVAADVTTEEPGRLAAAAAVLAPAGAGTRRRRARVPRAAVPEARSGPEAARACSRGSTSKRIWGDRSRRRRRRGGCDPRSHRGAQAGDTRSRAVGRGARDAPARLERAALRAGDRLERLPAPRRAALRAAEPDARPRRGSRFASALGRGGYGVSPSMARRCFERLDEEGITGADPRAARALRHGHVATQGPVWLVAGRSV